MVITNQFLIEFDTYDSVTASVIVERFCTGTKYITKRTETPSLAKYLPLIKDAGAIEQYLFGKSRTTGITVSAAGKIDLNNASRLLDYLEDRGVDGRAITIREKTGSEYPADFPVRFLGTIEAISFSDRTISLDIKSIIYDVKQEVYQPIKYAGTNNGSSIYEEGTADLQGTPKPKVLGDCSNANMPMFLVDRANEIYQLSSDPIDTINTVYVGRAVITAGTAFTTRAAFIASVTATPPTAGTYEYYLGDRTAAEGSNNRGCYIAFGTTPNLQPTFNATEGWKNLALYSEDYTNAAWIKSNVTVTTNTDTAPNGLVVADTFTATAANGTVLQTVTIASASYEYSVWLKRKTGTGAVAITVNGGTTWETKTLTTSYQRFYVTPVTTANPQFGIRITTSGDAVYAFGSQTEKFSVPSGYVATTSAAAYNHSAMNNLWKVMNLRGFALDADSVAATNAVNSSPTGVFVNAETQIGAVMDFLADSIKAYVSDNVEGDFICGVFKVPTSGEIVRIFDSRILLGAPKISKIRQQDLDRGIPLYRAIINYNRNYTVMNESQIVGASSGDIPFVSQDWRSVVDETASTLTKHLNAGERTIDTALTVKADAITRAVFESTLYNQIRLIVEIRVPYAFGFDIDRNDVIQVENRIYRIIGKFLKFPSVDNRLSTNAIVLQGWGGVVV